MENLREADAVITAAGLSSRMHDLKAVLPVGGRPAAACIVEKLLAAGVKRVFVVTGHREEEIKASLRDYPVYFVRNENYAASQMLDSIKCGLAGREQAACTPEPESGSADRACLVTPVDVPLFSVATVKALLACKGDYCIPVCGGRKGHPIL